MKWQTEAGYNQRPQVEAQIGRRKQVIGDRIQARDCDNQTVEAQIVSKALNRMTALGRAVYELVFRIDWVWGQSASKLISATRLTFDYPVSAG